MGNYYQKVAKYYNVDAESFECRYWENSTLQKIRQEFREQIYRADFENLLEIGFGTGIDIVHFAKTYPKKKIFGIDVSPEMYRHCNQKLRTENLANAFISVGTPEEIPDIFKDQKFDLIYVFFGALNTTNNLEKIPEQLEMILTKNGQLVLTFVNKWYLTEIFLQLLKLNFIKAFARFRKFWGGYSSAKYLESRCYSPYEIRNIFQKKFSVVNKRGYSILYPAWYRNHWVTRMSEKPAGILWKADEWLNKTFVWMFGEYFLYSFRRR